MYGVELLQKMAREYAINLSDYYSELYNKNLMPKNEESKAYFLFMILSEMKTLIAESYPEAYADYESRE